MINKINISFKVQMNDADRDFCKSIRDAAAYNRLDLLPRMIEMYQEKFGRIEGVHFELKVEKIQNPVKSFSFFGGVLQGEKS